MIDSEIILDGLLKSIYPNVSGMYTSTDAGMIMLILFVGAVLSIAASQYHPAACIGMVVFFIALLIWQASATEKRNEQRQFEYRMRTLCIDTELKEKYDKLRISLGELQMLLEKRKKETDDLRLSFNDGLKPIVDNSKNE